MINTVNAVFKLFKKILIHFQDDAYIKKRVTIAVGLLVGAKLLNVSVPFIFKYAIDGLNTGLSMNTPADTLLTASVALMIGCE